MRQPMSARERILLTAMVCLTLIVMVPMTALAATGQLVNIIDPSNSSRQAKVTDVGALQVQMRPGIPQNSFNGRNHKAGAAWLSLYENPSTRATAVVQATIAAHEGQGFYLIRLGWVSMNSGSACSGAITLTGYWRQVTIPPGETLTLDFSGSPLVLAPAASGRKTCVGIWGMSVPSGGIMSGGVSGYTYTP